MARGKNDDEVTEVKDPDFEKMKRIFQGDIKPADEQTAKARGDLSAAWKTIEDDCACNKRAARQLYKLFGESEETRDDFLRTFVGGLIALDLMPREDLVDMMGETKVPNVTPLKRARGLGAEGMPALQ